MKPLMQSDELEAELSQAEYNATIGNQHIAYDSHWFVTVNIIAATFKDFIIFMLNTKKIL